MTKLKPCPFCGGEARSHFRITNLGGNSDAAKFYVKCDNCGISKTKELKTAPDCSFEDLVDTIDFTIEMWNRRLGS